MLMLETIASGALACLRMGGVPVAPTRIVAAGEEAPGRMTCRSCSKRSADRQPYAYLVILISRCAVEFSLAPLRSARLVARRQEEDPATELRLCVLSPERAESCAEEYQQVSYTARKLIDRVNPECELEVDGGVDLTTAPPCAKAGANVFVAGTSIFGAKAGPRRATAELAGAVRS